VRDRVDAWAARQPADLRRRLRTLPARWLASGAVTSWRACGIEFVTVGEQVLADDAELDVLPLEAFDVLPVDPGSFAMPRIAPRMSETTPF